MSNAPLPYKDITRYYIWDGADRPLKVLQGGQSYEFAYDGLGRRVSEKYNGVLIKQFVWDGAELAEERDANNNVYKRFFDQGEQINGNNYYFVRDHLGSVTAMYDSTGALRAKYAYEPYGTRTKLTGNMDSDFGFTGHYLHAPSNLLLTHYRAYDPNTSRWISRDPIEEEGGVNLYGYVKNNPINYLDPLGLKTCWKWVHMTYFGDYRGNPKNGIPADTEGAYKNGPLGPGDIAVGNYGAGPNTPKTGQLEGPNQPAYPAGSSMGVYPSNAPAFTGRVSDWGSFNIKHPQYPTNGWIDIWNPAKSKAGESDEGWISFEVKDGCSCPK